MSLVAYASSDESEPDEAEPEPEEEEAAAPPSGPTLGGLFASLPAPKGPALLPPPPQMLAPAFPPPRLLPPPAGDPRLQPPPPLPFGLGGFPPPPGVSPAEAAGVGEGLGLPSPRGPGLGLPPSMGGAGPPLGLPKPKKRTEPVKIAAPELHQGDVSMGWGAAPGSARGPAAGGRGPGPLPSEERVRGLWDVPMRAPGGCTALREGHTVSRPPSQVGAPLPCRTCSSARERCAWGSDGTQGSCAPASLHLNLKPSGAGERNRDPRFSVPGS